MRLAWGYLCVIFVSLSDDVLSIDGSPKLLRRQLKKQQWKGDASNTNSQRNAASDEIDFEQWGRWLQLDFSMKTSSPVNPITQQPTSTPVIAPVSPPMAPMAPIPPPVMPLAPIPLPTIPVTPIPPSTVPVAPIPPPAIPVTPPLPATLLPVTMAPKKAPTASPITIAPTSKAPTRAPVQPPIAPDQTLLRVIQSTPELSTLLSAITTSDENRKIQPFLIPLLNSSSTLITVFAPVNEGFTRLAQIVPGYLSQLLTPDFGLHLLEILAYHTTTGILPRSSFPRSNLQMLAGGNVNVTATSSGFIIESFSSESAGILPPPNVRASNGLIHIVNNVLLPEFVLLDLIEGVRYANTRNNGQFSTLLRLISAAGLQSVLSEASGVTLVAPVNSGISMETERFLLLPGNEGILSDILRYHVLTTMFNFAVFERSSVTLVDTLLQGSKVIAGVVPMAGGPSFVRFNQAVQLSYWLSKENIIYAVDRLLIPPNLENVVPGGVTTNITAASFGDSFISETSSSSTKPNKKKQMKRSEVR